MSDVRGVELETTRMSGATQMGVPECALDVSIGIADLSFGPSSFCDLLGWCVF